MKIFINWVLGFFGYELKYIDKTAEEEPMTDDGIINNYPDYEGDMIVVGNFAVPKNHTTFLFIKRMGEEAFIKKEQELYDSRKKYGVGK